MNKVGFAMLAHSHLRRAEQLVSHLCGAGAEVTLHIDIAASREEVTRAGFPHKAKIIQTRRANWGSIGLIDATLDAVRDLRQRAADLTHICLISGSDLPLRPISEMEAYVERHGSRDHIESQSIENDKWVVDGLAEERVTLFHPFSYRTTPNLFSFSVDLQRKFGVRRKMPDGLRLHLGMQWWCLSTETLDRILNHDRLPEWRTFFRRSWIPDESFFQTLVRLVRPEQIPLPGLHLNRFNPQGRPAVFHDDHQSLLEATDFFFARKVDPDAERLYQRFLNKPATASGSANFDGKVDETAFENAHGKDALVTPGLIAAHRLPVGTTPTRAETAASYFVFSAGSTSLLQTLRETLVEKMPALAFHGRLFAPGEPAEFEQAGSTWKGNVHADPRVRDDRPAQFLANVIRMGLPRRTAFLLGPEDDLAIRLQLCIDAKARLILLHSEQDAVAVLEKLRQPAVLPCEVKRPLKRKKRVERSPLWSWHRLFDPDVIVSDLSGTAPGAGIAGIAEVLRSDPLDPVGWRVLD